MTFPIGLCPLAAALLCCGIGAGCRIGFDPTAVDVDSGTRDADRCAYELEELGPWSQPTPLTTLNMTTADEDPALRADLLELFFVSTRSGTRDIWRSTRASELDLWGAPEQVLELADAAQESTLELSPDGLTLWFSSNRPGGPGNDDIWVTTRTVLGASWTTPVLVSELSSPGLDRGMTVFDDGRSIAFHSNRAGGAGINDIYVATRPSIVDAWSTPISIGTPPNSTASEQHPWVSPCGLQLFFHSYAGSTTAKLQRTRRDSRTAAFMTPQPIVELNVAGSDDKDLRVSPSMRYAIFASTRGGNLDLYDTSR